MNGNPKKKLKKKKKIYWPGGPVENQLLWPELARPPKKCVRASGHIANQCQALMEIGSKLFLALYAQKQSPTLNAARYAIFRNNKKVPPLKNLPSN